uniref:Uncharacterized protein n=1 Tax=Aegilops tauschii subsp. strangulata TaxID=200361 RepID=A0A453RIA5_AEGTS
MRRTSPSCCLSQQDCSKMRLSSLNKTRNSLLKPREEKRRLLVCLSRPAASRNPQLHSVPLLETFQRKRRIHLGCRDQTYLRVQVKQSKNLSSCPGQNKAKSLIFVSRSKQSKELIFVSSLHHLSPSQFTTGQVLGYESVRIKVQPEPWPAVGCAGGGQH